MGVPAAAPAARVFDRVEQRVAERQAVLDAAFRAHPERFAHGRPIAKRPEREVWINKPLQLPSTTESSIALAH